MRILITGAAGMLGLDVQAAAARSGHEVLPLNRADLDIADADAVVTAVSRLAPDAVINCAAYTQVDRSEEDPDSAARVNETGAGNVAAAASAAGAWLVHVSTDYVFDGTKTTGPYVESDPTAPRSVYGITKLAGERAVAAAAPDSHTIARTAWLFGLGGPCFPATILRVAATRPEMTVVDDQIGSPTFTPHLAEALVALAESRSVPGLAHVAAAGQCSWFDFASGLVGFAATAVPDTTWATIRPCTTEQYPLPAPRPAFSVLRSERPGVPTLPEWRSGMAEYLQRRFTAEVDA